MSKAELAEIYSQIETATGWTKEEVDAETEKCFAMSEEELLAYIATKLPDHD